MQVEYKKGTCNICDKRGDLIQVRKGVFLLYDVCCKNCFRKIMREIVTLKIK